jgi:DnaJ like chaperone protein
LASFLLILQHKNQYRTIMAMGKWIGGFLGMMVAGPLGAIAGFVLGSLFDKGSSENQQFIDNDNYNSKDTYGNGTYGNNYGNGTYGSSYGSGPYGGYQTQQQMYEGQRNTFRFSLLVLASYIIRADGKVMHSEMNLVRQWLRVNFGEASVSEGEEIMKRLFNEQKRLGMPEFRTAVLSSCRQLRQIMPYEQRLQLLSFLVNIAQADGMVVTEEVSALREIATDLGLSEADLDSMLNLHDASSNLDAAYKVLGVAPTATDDEIKAAYRKLSLKNHPDRVASLGEDVRKAAEKKFQEINAAMETVKKARNMKS